VSLSNSIDVDRPPDATFTYVTDPARFAEWQNGVVSGHMDDNAPVTVGARCVTTRRIGFAERPSTAEVTHVDPPRTWTVRGIDGPIRAEVHVTIEPLESGKRSRVTIDLDFTGHGIGKLLVPLVVRPQARTEMSTNMRKLKERLEQDGGT
jgi:carbon monoxide dehydrogenase subunit G